MVPLLPPAKLRLHCRDFGSYKRRFRPSKCPSGLSASSSTRLPRPFHTLRTTLVPSYSIQVVEPVNGWSKRLRWVFQEPISKSKSCCPSRSTRACSRPALARSAFCCARPQMGCNITTKLPASRPLRICLNIVIFTGLRLVGLKMLALTCRNQHTAIAPGPVRMKLTRIVVDHNSHFWV
jgi:hypothetical protein